MKRLSLDAIGDMPVNDLRRRIKALRELALQKDRALREEQRQREQQEQFDQLPLLSLRPPKERRAHMHARQCSQRTPAALSPHPFTTTDCASRAIKT